MKTALRTIIITGITACITTASTPTFANDTLQSALNFAIGYYDVFDKQDGVDLRVEYRSHRTFFPLNLKPWTGIEITSEGSLWGGAGLLYDWNFKDNWYLTPSIGAGLYKYGGSDKDLKHPIQFRSQLELSHKFKTGHRVGISLSHMSNAGLGSDNPGTETMSLSWSHPF